MNLDDELQRLFNDDRLELRPQPDAEHVIASGARRRRRRRRELAVGGGVLAAVVAVVAEMSLSGVGRVDQLQPAVPTTSSTTVTTTETPSTTTDRPPASTTAVAPPPSSASPSTTTSVAKPGAPTTLGPNTYGALRLGMTRQQAFATGMFGSDVQTASVPGDCTVHTMTDAKGVKYGSITYSERLGVAAVWPENSPRTPESIRAGSTRAQALAAYPAMSFPYGENSQREGTGVVQVAGGSKVVYQISFADAKVTKVEMYLAEQDCFS